IVDGRLYTGSTGAAGEIGYLPLGGDGRSPHRRWGALEEAAAAAGLVRTARELGMRPPLTGLKVFTAARRGDVTARKAIAGEASRRSACSQWFRFSRPPAGPRRPTPARR